MVFWHTPKTFKPQKHSGFWKEIALRTHPPKHKKRNWKRMKKTFLCVTPPNFILRRGWSSAFWVRVGWSIERTCQSSRVVVRWIHAPSNTSTNTNIKQAKSGVGFARNNCLLVNLIPLTILRILRAVCNEAMQAAKTEYRATNCCRSAGSMSFALILWRTTCCEYETWHPLNQQQILC